MNYDKMRAMRMKLRREFRLPPDQGQGYHWEWTDAMSGVGPPVPDSIIWQRRYEEAAEDLRQARSVILQQADIIRKLRGERKDDL